MSAQVDPEIQKSYRRAIARVGEQVTFIRISGQPPRTAKFSATVSAVVRDYVPEHNVLEVKREGAIGQGMRHIIVLDDDLIRARFPMPLRKNDKAVIRGSEMNIEHVDASKRGVAGATEAIAVGKDV